MHLDIFRCLFSATVECKEELASRHVLFASELDAHACADCRKGGGAGNRNLATTAGSKLIFIASCVEREMATIDQISTTSPLAARPDPATAVAEPENKDEEENNTDKTLVKRSIRPGAKTSDFYSVKNIPERFNHPDWFEGYQTKSEHPFFSTSSSTYGSKSPSVHTMPTQFSGRSQKFTQNLGKFGMYRNHSLNTDLDHSKV